MGQYAFSYELPENFQEQLIRHCQLNECSDIAQRLKRCTLDYEDVGLAYYAGLKGDNWDKKALDFTIGGSENDTSYLKLKRKALESIIQKLLRPSKTGFLLRTIDFIVEDGDFEVVYAESGKYPFIFKRGKFVIAVNPTDKEQKAPCKFDGEQVFAIGKACVENEEITMLPQSLVVIKVD